MEKKWQKNTRKNGENHNKNGEMYHQKWGKNLNENEKILPKIVQKMENIPMKMGKFCQKWQK